MNTGEAAANPIAEDGIPDMERERQASPNREVWKATSPM